MAVSLQVLYPAREGTHFDQDYYAAKHIPLVHQYMGDELVSTLVAKGIAGGPDAPAGFYAIATMTFADNDALQKALAKAGPILADIPNYTNTEPEMLIGEVIG
ncbi:MAG: EthD family reductase [Roseibium sp.]|nr:EthD family reductase [Roseibium sp.]